MTPEGFRADLEATPTALLALAGALDDVDWPVARGDRLILTGMGSSWFAAETAARRMRAAGIKVTAEIASAEALAPPARDLTVVGITAGGGSLETLRHLAAHRGRSHTVALTNNTAADLPADDVVHLHAGDEAGGVACRSYVHTLVQLLHLEHQMAGSVPALPDRGLRRSRGRAPAGHGGRLAARRRPHPPRPRRHMAAGPGRAAGQRTPGRADAA